MIEVEIYKKSNTYEDISKRYDEFMPHYFINHPDDILNPLNGISDNKELINTLNYVPNCRYINGVVTWLSLKSCNILIKEFDPGSE